MNLSYDVIQELKRHFVGGPSEPSRFWLARVEGPQLGCFGEGVRESAAGYFLHFGPVPALGEQSRIVFVENSGQSPLRIALRNPNSWLRVRWQGQGQEVRLAGGEKAVLEIVFRGAEVEAKSYAGSVLLVGEAETGEEATVELGVRLTTFLEGAFGSFSFGGLPEPRPHDFGLIDPGSEAAGVAGEVPPFTVAVESVGSEPLRVSFEDLPDWLSAEVGGYRRVGPAPGVFFEHRAPVRLDLRPLRDPGRLGTLASRITLRSNDVRPALRLVPLDLSARIARERPYVSAAEVFPVAVARPRRRLVEIHLANSGSTPARLELVAKSHPLALAELPELPAAGELEPGRAVVRGELAVEDLATGPQLLELRLRVHDGDPPELRIKVPVTVVEIACAPEMLDFGALRAGERRERAMSFSAGDGRALHLEVKVMPGAESFLSAEAAADGTLRAVCHPPAGAAFSRFDAHGLEVSEPRLGFRRHVRVRWEPQSGWLARLRGPASCVLLGSLAGLASRGGLHAW